MREAAERAGMRFAMIEECMTQATTAIVGQQHGLAAVEDARNIQPARRKGAENSGSTSASGAAVAQPTMSSPSQAATMTAPSALANFAR